MEKEQQLVIRAVSDAWHSRITAADELFNGLTDEQLSREIAPGRNRGLYLLGHLTAVHDKMLPLLNFEPQVYPQLDEPFLSKPDKSVAEIPSTKQLREYWKTVNSKLSSHLKAMSEEEWFQKHTSVS